MGELQFYLQKIAISLAIDEVMRVYQLKNSSYWGANLHVGFYADGRKKFSRRSSKVRVDPKRVCSNTGRRFDIEEATRVLQTMQASAYEVMNIEGNSVPRARFEDMVDSLIRACGKSVAKSPGFSSFVWPWFERHCEHRNLAKSSISGYRGFLRAFEEWLDSDKDASIDSFDLAAMQSYYDDQLEFLAPSTIRNHFKVLRMVFERALNEGLIDANPCSGVQFKSFVSIGKEPFTVSEVESLLLACREWPNRIEFADEWLDVCRFAAVTGARGCDCYGLKGADFFEVEGAGLRVSFDQDKTKGSVALLLPDRLAEIFRDRISSAGGGGLLFPNLSALKAGRNGPGARFVGIMDLAGIVYSEEPPRSPRGKTQRSHSFHSFRHFVSTELEADGVSRGTNQYVTGHKDARVKEGYITKQLDSVRNECAGTWDRICEVF